MVAGLRRRPWRASPEPAVTARQRAGPWRGAQRPGRPVPAGGRRCFALRAAGRRTSAATATRNRRRWRRRPRPSRCRGRCRRGALRRRLLGGEHLLYGLALLRLPVRVRARRRRARSSLLRRRLGFGSGDVGELIVEQRQGRGQFGQARGACVRGCNCLILAPRREFRAPVSARTRRAFGQAFRLFGLLQRVHQQTHRLRPSSVGKRRSRAWGSSRKSSAGSCSR